MASFANELTAVNSANRRALKIVIPAGGLDNAEFHVLSLNQVAVLVLANADFAVVCKHVGTDRGRCIGVG